MTWVAGRPSLILQPSLLNEKAPSNPRPCVRGKSFFIDDEGFYTRGVTYRTFSALEDGSEYPIPAVAGS
jgi:hypothetical protein